MNLKYKKYDNYKPSGVEWLGDVPEHWGVKRVKAISRIKRGASPRPIADPRYFSDNGEYSWVRIADVTANSHYLLETKDTLSKLGANLSVKIYEGELFLSIAGSVGKPMISKIKCCIHDGFVYFPDLKKGQEFLYRIFETGRPYVGLGKHGTQLNLNTETIANIKIPFPPLEEQTAIANFLDRKTTQIDKAIAQKEQLIELLKERRQILIHEELSKAEKESEVIRLKYILNSKLKYGANESGVEYSKSLPRYVRITDFGKDGKLNDKTKLSLTWEIGKEYLLDDGDILFARSGATVGKTYQFKKSMSKEKYYSYAGYLIKAEPNSDFILSDYLYLFTNSDFFNSWKESIFNKATIENIGADKYSQLPVILPSITKQKEILSTINNQSQKIKTAISLKQQEIAALKEYKTVLIDAAVTGKIVVD
jgi:type I restriction enzyme S subunit